MEDQPKWRAKLASACFLTLVGEIFIGSLIVGLVSLGMGPDLQDLPFPNTLYAIIPLIVGGLVLGYVWQRTGGNTTASALMHGVYDLIAIATAYFLTI